MKGMVVIKLGQTPLLMVCQAIALVNGCSASSSILAHHLLCVT